MRVQVSARIQHAVRKRREITGTFRTTRTGGRAGQLPSRLAWETTPDAVRLGFPAGSGTSAGDWDGSIRAITGNAFVPAGLSVWELSVQKSGIEAKADDDYGKRMSTPDGSPTAEAVYVEAILRPCWRR